MFIGDSCLRYKSNNYRTQSSIGVQSPLDIGILLIQFRFICWIQKESNHMKAKAGSSSTQLTGKKSLIPYTRCDFTAFFTFLVINKRLSSREHIIFLAILMIRTGLRYVEHYLY